MGLDDLFRRRNAGDSIPFVESLLRDFFGEKEPQESRPHKNETITEVIRELRDLTTDETDDEILVRALVTYREAVRQVKGGGTVKFLGPGTQVRTLKLRLR